MAARVRGRGPRLCAFPTLGVGLQDLPHTAIPHQGRRLGRMDLRTKRQRRTRECKRLLTALMGGGLAHRRRRRPSIAGSAPRTPCSTRQRGPAWGLGATTPPQTCRPTRSRCSRVNGFDAQEKGHPMIRIEPRILIARRMTRVAAAKLRRRSRAAGLLSLVAVGLALVVAGCGAATSGSGSPAGYRTGGARSTSPARGTGVGTPGVAAAPAPRAANTPSGAAAAPKPAPAVPQGNGGDSDPDNNGGPDDGDGGI
jgi:hypothetical protein